MPHRNEPQEPDARDGAREPQAGRPADPSGSEAEDEMQGERQEQAQRDVGPDGEAQPQIGFWTIVMSTMSAALGVQSRANKERDFRSGRVAPFIVAGILFTVLFVLTIVAVVSLVIP